MNEKSQCGPSGLGTVGTGVYKVIKNQSRNDSQA